MLTIGLAYRTGTPAVNAPQSDSSCPLYLLEYTFRQTGIAALPLRLFEVTSCEKVSRMSVDGHRSPRKWVRKKDRSLKIYKSGYLGWL